MIYSLQSIQKSYPTRHGLVNSLRSLTFDVQRGERVALIGPSGAGKTTLFRLLNATLRPTRGSLRFDGHEVAEMSGRDLRMMRRRIGTIYQQHHLVPSLTTLENTLCGRLGYWSLLHTLRNLVFQDGDETERAMAALQSVGLADKRHARADELSGGQQQRLTIARVLMQDPDVILADEPFASLDPVLTETIASLLLGLADGGKRTLVITLHDVDLALRYFPRVIGLREGSVMFDTTPANVSRSVLEELYAGNSSLKQLPTPDSDETSHAGVGPRACAR